MTVRFDGVYMLSEVWVNGTSMGIHPYGYTPFSYDITDQVRLGDNAIPSPCGSTTPKQTNSRWYSGSGIYRHVYLEWRDPVHVVPESVQVLTLSATRNEAALKIAVAAENDGGADADVSVATEIYELNADGKAAVTPAAKIGPATAKFESKDGKTLASIEAEVRVPDPRLWSPEHPNRYVAVTTLAQIWPSAGYGRNAVWDPYH